MSEKRTDEQIVAEALEQDLEGNSDPLEEIARNNGWKPEAEWKGDPPKDGFKSAADFVKAGFDIQHKQAEKIDRLQNNLESINEKLSSMAKGEAQRMRKALESQKERIEQERDEAIEIADREKVRKLDKQLRDTEKDIEELDREPENSQQQAFLAEEKKFLERNPWYNKNRAMTAYAMQSAETLGKVGEMGPEEFYAELEQMVRKMYPEGFENPNRSQSTVGSGRPKGNGSAKKTFDNLPPEAQEAWQEINMYTKMSKDDYAKSYFAENGE